MRFEVKFSHPMLERTLNMENTGFSIVGMGMDEDNGGNPILLLDVAFRPSEAVFDEEREEVDTIPVHSDNGYYHPCWESLFLIANERNVED